MKESTKIVITIAAVCLIIASPFYTAILNLPVWSMLITAGIPLAIMMMVDDKDTK